MIEVMGGNDGGNTVPPPLPKKMNKVMFCPCKRRYNYYYKYESIGVDQWKPHFWWIMNDNYCTVLCVPFQ